VEYNTGMKHGDNMVDILDARGEVIGSKPRHTINKMTDVYHGVYVLIVTPVGEMVLSSIPDRNDLPNLYVGTFGTTAATMRRNSESAEEAARRTLAQELYIHDEVPLDLLGERWLELDDGRRIFMSAFRAQADVPTDYNGVDIGGQNVLLPSQFHKMLQNYPERFSPTLRAIWREYLA
jgi:hypothetical protein